MVVSSQDNLKWVPSENYDRIMSSDKVTVKDVMDVIWCRGFKKFLKFSDCNKKNCEYHFGVIEEPIKRTENGVTEVVGVNRYIRCGVPKLVQVVSVCEV